MNGGNVLPITVPSCMPSCLVTVSGGFTHANDALLAQRLLCVLSSFHKAASGIEGYLLIEQCLKRSGATRVLSYRPKFVKVGSVRTGQLPVRLLHTLWNSGGLAAVTGVALASCL